MLPTSNACDLSTALALVNSQSLLCKGHYGATTFQICNISWQNFVWYNTNAAEECRHLGMLYRQAQCCTRNTVLEAALWLLEYEMCLVPNCVICLFISLLGFTTTTHCCSTEIVGMLPKWFVPKSDKSCLCSANQCKSWRCRHCAIKNCSQNFWSVEQCWAETISLRNR